MCLAWCRFSFQRGSEESWSCATKGRTGDRGGHQCVKIWSVPKNSFKQNAKIQIRQHKNGWTASTENLVFAEKPVLARRYFFLSRSDWRHRSRQKVATSEGKCKMYGKTEIAHSKVQKPHWIRVESPISSYLAWDVQTCLSALWQQSVKQLVHRMVLC